MRLLYIAGPYRAKTKQRRDLNIAACRHAGMLAAEKGWMPVIPCVNTAGFDDLLPDTSDQFWLDGTMTLLMKCDAILMVQGWETSEGAKAERKLAKELNMNVFHDTDELVGICN